MFEKEGRGRAVVYGGLCEASETDRGSCTSNVAFPRLSALTERLPHPACLPFCPRGAERGLLFPDTSRIRRSLGAKIPSFPTCSLSPSTICGLASSSAERFLSVDEGFYEPYRSSLLPVEAAKASGIKVCWSWAI